MINRNRTKTTTQQPKEKKMGIEVKFDTGKNGG